MSIAESSLVIEQFRKYIVAANERGNKFEIGSFYSRRSLEKIPFDSLPFPPQFITCPRSFHVIGKEVYVIHMTHKEDYLMKGHDKVIYLAKTVFFDRNPGFPEQFCVIKIHKRYLGEKILKEEWEFLKKFEGVEGFVQVLNLFEYPGKYGIQQTRLIERRCVCGDLLGVFEESSLPQKIFVAVRLVYFMGLMEKQGVVHGDIKLDNIFLNHFSEGFFDPVIGDPARRVKRENDTLILGTAGYMAPEVAASFIGEGVFLEGLPTRDAWALACTLYLLFLGQQVPWASSRKVEGKKDIFWRILGLASNSEWKIQIEKQLRTLEMENPEMKNFIDLILRMFHPDPEQRITAKEACERCQGWVPQLCGRAPLDFMLEKFQKTFCPTTSENFS